jgi:hypothetical protein
MDMRGRVEIANFSDIGQKRPHNEDSTGSDERLGHALIAGLEATLFNLFGNFGE